MSSDEEGQLTDNGDDGEILDTRIRTKTKSNTITSPNTSITDILYKELQVNEEEISRHTCFDTLHITGTTTMTTNDIFHYFHNRQPLFLEWIDENSCNAGWKDDLSAAEALYEHSKTIRMETGKRRSSADMDVDDDEGLHDENDEKSISSSDIPVPLPPGPVRWRYGNPHPKSNAIFIRFATKSDKKIKKPEMLSKKYVDEDAAVGIVSESMKSKIRSNVEKPQTKNPWGDLCQTWGINDSQEVFSEGVESMKTRLQRPKNDLRTRLGKRTRVIEEEDDEESEHSDDDEEDKEWTIKSKVPRLRMHADDEEVKRKRNTNDLRSRIKKKLPQDEDHADEEVPSVWSRLDTERDGDRETLVIESDNNGDDLRGVISNKRLSSRPEFRKKDLRSKINRHGKLERSPLRIELDNDIYKP